MGLLLRQDDIVAHVYELYTGLMGTYEPKRLGLQAARWIEEVRVSDAENLELSCPSSLRKSIVIFGKEDTTPGPGWLACCLFPPLLAWSKVRLV